MRNLGIVVALALVTQFCAPAAPPKIKTVLVVLRTDSKARLTAAALFVASGHRVPTAQAGQTYHWSVTDETDPALLLPCDEPLPARCSSTGTLEPTRIKDLLTFVLEDGGATCTVIPKGPRTGHFTIEVRLGTAGRGWTDAIVRGAASLRLVAPPAGPTRRKP
jgi:hypothetical protein